LTKRISGASDASMAPKPFENGSRPGTAIRVRSSPATRRDHPEYRRLRWSVTRDDEPEYRSSATVNTKAIPIALPVEFGMYDLAAPLNVLVLSAALTSIALLGVVLFGAIE
jgi:hypothetical protein